MVITKKDLLRILRMCCVCKKIEVEGEWVGETEYPNYQEKVNKHNLTHGYCPVCLEKAKKEVEELKKNRYNLMKKINH